MIILLCVILRDDLGDTTCSIYGVGRPLPRAPALLLVYRAFGVPDTRTTANITNDPGGLRESANDLLICIYHRQQVGSIGMRYPPGKLCCNCTPFVAHGDTESSKQIKEAESALLLMTQHYFFRG